MKKLIWIFFLLAFLAGCTTKTTNLEVSCGGPYTANFQDPLSFEGIFGTGTINKITFDYGDGTYPDVFTFDIPLEAIGAMEGENILVPPLHSYDDKGEYTFTLTAESPDGQTASCNTQITIL